MAERPSRTRPKSQEVRLKREYLYNTIKHFAFKLHVSRAE